MHSSGEQTRIRHGDQLALLVEVGGGLRCYRVGTRDVVDGYGKEMVSGARGQPLVPWPNRLHTGRYVWDGVQCTVPLDEPEQSNALHGLTRWRSWSAEDVTPSSATLRLLLRPSPAYPFHLDVAVEYALDDDGLTVTTTGTNAGDVDAPYGHGAHPYLRLSRGTVGAAELQVPARTWLPPDPAQIPIGRESVADSPYDFREARPIGSLHMDHTFTDLDRDVESRCTVTLRDPDSGERVSLWMDSSYRYVQIYTGDTLPEQDRRRRALGVEPMTCPPDAFRSGPDVQRLAPGESTRGSWGIRPH